MLNPDKQTVIDLMALPKTAIEAAHGVGTGPEGPNQLPQDGGQ
jgi:hypothetical protein